MVTISSDRTRLSKPIQTANPAITYLEQACALCLLECIAEVKRVVYTFNNSDPYGEIELFVSGSMLRINIYPEKYTHIKDQKEQLAKEFEEIMEECFVIKSLSLKKQILVKPRLS